MYLVPKSFRSWNCKRFDYMQVGYMLAYILQEDIPVENYHKMSFESLSDNIKEDPFLKSLICKGIYNSEELPKSMISKHNRETNQAVINEQTTTCN